MAPTVPGVSRLCICEDELIVALSNTAGFQALTGAGSPAAAQAFIYVNELPAPADPLSDEYTIAEYDALFPLCVIYEPDTGAVEVIHASDGGPSAGYVTNYAFVLQFEAFRAAVGTNEDRHRAFKDPVHVIMEELRAEQAWSRITHDRADHGQPLVPEGNERMIMTFTVEREIEVP